MSRVDELADRPAGYADARRVPYRSLVPLDEVIGEVLGIGPKTRGVRKEYEILVRSFSSELNVLLNASLPDMAAATKPGVAEGIRRVREGKLTIVPGYDGEYGKVKIFDEAERKSFGKPPQRVLF